MTIPDLKNNKDSKNKKVTDSVLPLYIPTVSSSAGSSLTLANWEEIGIEYISCSLSALLIKPGFQVLQSINNLKDYLGWSGKIVLNASNFPEINNQGCYKFRSPYDGSFVQIEENELFSLILHLQPDLIVLSPNLTKIKSMGNIQSFVHLLQQSDIQSSIQDNQSRQNLNNSFYHFYSQEHSESGHPYASDNKQKAPSQLIFCITEEDSIVRLTNYFSYPSLEFSEITAQIAYIETNLPAQDAISGKVYTTKSQDHQEDLSFEKDSYNSNNDSNGDFGNFAAAKSKANPVSIIQLTDLLNPKPHQVIDENCQCPTCAQGLTQAYLQHLFFNTPLLCYRFLIQHNAYFYLNTLKKTNSRILRLI